jgi:nickel-type superoxide dismutase maturation protease
VEGHGRAERDALAGLTERGGPAEGPPLRTRIALAAILVEAAAAGIWLASRAVRFVRRSWHARVAVEGASMAPTLLAGDWLLVDPDGYARRAARIGELVLVHDPRRTDRLLVKRVASTFADGSLEVVGDARAASTDSRAFGAVDPAGLAGRPWFRYWPPARMGPIR